MLIIDIEGVVITAENVDGILGSNLLNFECVFLLLPGFCCPSDFQRFRVSPPKHFAALSEAKSMVGSTGNFLDLGLSVGVEDLLGDLDGLQILAQLLPVIGLNDFG